MDGGGTVGGGTMQVHRTGGSLIGGQAAGQQGGGHARQHVPAAATGKAGVAGGVHAHPAVRGRYHRTGTFEHHHGVPRLRIPQGRALPVRVDLRRRQAGEPGHLAGVGRDDQLPRRVWEGCLFCQQPGCGVQAVGVQHGTARKTGQKLLHKGLCLGGAGRTLGGAAKAGAKQQNGCFLPPEQRHVFRGNTALGPCPAGAQAALRQAGCGGAHHRFHTGKGHDARPGAQCALCGQQCSAPVECAARHGQHTAKGALMAVPRAAGDILPDKFFGNFNSHHSTSGRTI